VAAKEPREVAGLGRAETPAEKNDRVQKARQERRARQTMRNLVWSLLVSLGLVALLIVVVVRPDTNLVEDIDWVAVAEEGADSLPSDPLYPRMSELWSSNRAEITTEPGAEVVWSIGLLGPENSYVSFDQGFGADIAWLAAQVDGAPVTGEVEFGYGVDTLTWQEYDRTESAPGANNAYALALEQEGFFLVVSGTSQQAVAEIVEDVTFQLTTARR
jgi:hypothetical protein